MIRKIDLSGRSFTKIEGFAAATKRCSFWLDEEEIKKLKYHAFAIVEPHEQNLGGISPSATDNKLKTT